MVPFPSSFVVVVVAMNEGMRNNAQPREQDNIHIHNLPTTAEGLRATAVQAVS